MPGETDPAMGQDAGEREVLYWRAPMDPNYTSDQPGKSPMGMDLVPVYAEEATADGGIRVSQSFLQNFAVRTAMVHRGTLPVSIRTVGILAHNEERVVSVQTKYEGWIERASVNNVGETVTRGDVLFEIYSPQLVTTQREFLGAMEYVGAASRRWSLRASDRAGTVAPRGGAGAAALLGHDRGADRRARRVGGSYANGNGLRACYGLHRRQDGRLDGGDEAQPRDDGPQDRRPLDALGRDRVLRGRSAARPRGTGRRDRGRRLSGTGVGVAGSCSSAPR